MDYYTLYAYLQDVGGAHKPKDRKKALQASGNNEKAGMVHLESAMHA